jgi:hypothetical protein
MTGLQRQVLRLQIRNRYTCFTILRNFDTRLRDSAR